MDYIQLIDLIQNRKYKKETGRRGFIKSLGYLLWIPVFGLIYKLLSQYKPKEKDQVSLAFPSSDGVTFAENVIVVREKGFVLALSSKCTHLGCRIIDQEAGILVCPCHGSRFDLMGRPIKGPAHRPLQKLEFRKSDDNLSLIIKLPEG